MGFCLFEYATKRGRYMAVNPAFVKNVVAEEPMDEVPVVTLVLSCALEGEFPKAIGTVDDVQETLLKATKVAVVGTELKIISGNDLKKTLPGVVNNLHQVMIVEELFPDEVPGEMDSPTINRMTGEDGKVRYIVERPGQFIMKANRGGEIIALTYR